MIDIEKAIPHRPPFLFVDRIVSAGGGKIVAEKDLSPDLDFFSGHYPGRPIMPGVLSCEAIIQAGAILIAHEAGGELDGAPVLTRIRDAKFKKMVGPGETLRLEVELEERLQSAYYMKGKALVNGKAAVTLSFTCALASETGETAA